jgi:phospholipid/cholesterol/gamma-HCH transport system permease protein
MAFVSKNLSETETTFRRAPVAAYQSYSNYVGSRLIRLIHDIHGIGALLLITMGVIVNKYNKSRAIIHPLIRKQIVHAGFSLLPMVAFLACALGMVVVGQMILMLKKLGAESYAGTIMVTAVVRELGPILAALLVLARAGTANVVELGTARASGEVEALEALGIDPIHYLVVPRVIALSLSIFALTIYLILITLFSGYLFAFLEGLGLLPGDYFRQLANAFIWQDFVLLALKTLFFGALIAIVTCYEGLAQPLRMEEVSRATTSAVAKCVVGVVVLDALFVLVYTTV